MFFIIKQIIAVIVATVLTTSIATANPDSDRWDHIERLDDCRQMGEVEYIDCMLAYRRANDWSNVYFVKDCENFKGQLNQIDCKLHFNMRMLEIDESVLRRKFVLAMSRRLDREAFRHHLESSRETFKDLGTNASDAARFYYSYIIHLDRISKYRLELEQLVVEDSFQKTYVANLDDKISEWQKFYVKICDMILADMENLCRDIDFHPDFNRHLLSSR